MSGGYFEHDQYRIGQIADKIEDVIYDNDNPKEDEYNYEFSKETMREFKRAVNLLRLAQICAHRIDWLLSGDDGEETFHKRLLEDLTKYAGEIE